MLFFITIIFCCQLIGEFAARVLGIPLPGPVIGMLLLLAMLMIRGGIPDDLARVCDGLLQNLSLLFVPAGVGIMLHGAVLGQGIVAISLALVLSTLLTIAVTGLIMSRLQRQSAPPDLTPMSDGGHE